MAAIRSRRGASFALLSQIGSGSFAFGVSTSLYLEYSSKLLQSAETGAVQLTEAQVAAIIAAIANAAVPVPIFFRLRPNLRDEGDNFVFECAAHFGAHYIVTHNVKDFRTIEIRGYSVQPIRPGEFLEMLKKENT